MSIFLFLHLLTSYEVLLGKNTTVFLHDGDHALSSPTATALLLPFPLFINSLPKDVQPHSVANIMWSLNGYPYFAFISDKPNFEWPLLKSLKISSATVTLEPSACGFELSTSIAKQWFMLEQKLQFIMWKLLG